MYDKRRDKRDFSPRGCGGVDAEFLLHFDPVGASAPLGDLMSKCGEGVSEG